MKIYGNFYFIHWVIIFGLSENCYLSVIVLQKCKTQPITWNRSHDCWKQEGGRVYVCWWSKVGLTLLTKKSSVWSTAMTAQNLDHHELEVVSKPYPVFSLTWSTWAQKVSKVLGVPTFHVPNTLPCTFWRFRYLLTNLLLWPNGATAGFELDFWIFAASSDFFWTQCTFLADFAAGKTY